MDIENKISLVKRPPTEELIQEDELKTLFETNQSPKHYIGIEMSGKLHLGSLLITGFKINDFIKAGIQSSVYLADWHSYINDKFDGDWDRIKQVTDYYEEAFKFFCPGVNIIKSNSLYHNNDEYWMNLIKFSKHMTLSRAVRCLTIMGRSEKDQLSLSQYLYPSMQAVDIKELDLDIVHAGTDQRKIHMLVREVFPKMNWKVPIAVHQHLIPGLSKADEQQDAAFTKMSKSNPKNSIFIHDSEDDINSKIKTGWCPEKISENNPILEYCQYILFHESGTFTIERPSKFGGDMTFSNYQELESEYVNGNIHPLDLKLSVGRKINDIISPIRAHFSNKSSLFYSL